MTKKPDLSAAYDLRTPEDSRRLYRIWAETYDADFVEGHGYRMPQRIAEVYIALGGGWPCLDVGCGTGAVGRHMPDGAVVDGIDISPDMLRVAGDTGHYRDLHEADLTRALDLPQATWAGMTSSGTFTTGHVGPDAIGRLLPHLRPGAVAAFTVKSGFYEIAGFDTALHTLAEEGRIADRDVAVEPIYEAGRAPEGHADDTGLIVTFRRV